MLTLSQMTFPKVDFSRILANKSDILETLEELLSVFERGTAPKDAYERETYSRVTYICYAKRYLSKDVSHSLFEDIANAVQDALNETVFTAKGIRRSSSNDVISGFGVSGWLCLQYIDKLDEDVQDDLRNADHSYICLDDVVRNYKTNVVIGIPLSMSLEKFMQLTRIEWLKRMIEDVKKG